MKSLFIFSEELSRVEFSTDHLFKPVRARNTLDLCERYGLLGGPSTQVIPPLPASPEQLALFHEAEYVDILERIDSGEFDMEMFGRGLGTEENPVFQHFLDWCLQTTGATLTGVEALDADEADVAFNPLGGFHHAGRGGAEGFCYVNDVGVAVETLLARGRRVAVVDLDAHHGNGVQDGFYEDDRVLTISLHESGRTLYPWAGEETLIGEGRGRGFNVNVPLEVKTDDEVYLMAFHEIVPPLLEAFSADIVISEIGADTIISDPLTHLRLTNNGYKEAVTTLGALAPKFLALGAGGYDLFRTSRCWTLAWAGLNRLTPKDEFAGLVGGMMFGPEMEMGSLYDRPLLTKGPDREKAEEEARRVIRSIKETVFPILGAGK